MSSSQWFRGPICGVDNCRSRLFRNQDGLTICQYGHVMEGAVEFNDEDFESVTQTRRLNAVQFNERGHLTRNERKMITKNKQERLIGEDARDCYLKLLQMMMKVELSYFVKLYMSDNIYQDFKLIVKTNWILVLTNSNSLDILDVVLIIYLSSLQIQSYPVYITDIIRGIKTNEIPYTKTLHLLPKKILDILPTSFQIRLQPFALPRKNQIISRIRKLKDYLPPIEAPISYYFLYIYKMYSDLVLPNAPDLFVYTVRLINELERGTDIIMEIWIASVMMVIIVFSFKMDDNEYSLSGYLKEFEKFDLSTNFETDVLNWSDEKTNNYCDRIYELLKNQTEPTFMEKKLHNIFNLDNDSSDHEPTQKDDNDFMIVMNKIKSYEKTETSKDDIENLQSMLITNFSELLHVQPRILTKSFESVLEQIDKIKR